MNQKVELEEAFAALIGQNPWDQFCTFTYRQSVWASEKVERDLKRTVRNATASLMGMKSSSKKFCKAWALGNLMPWFIAIEKHKHGTLHAHALIGDRTRECRTLSRQLIEKIWNRDIRNAGFTKIEKVRSNGKAVDYMIKSSRYCCKDPDAILDWSPDLQRWDECRFGAFPLVS